MADLLDPQIKNEEKDLFDPTKNASQKDYDEKFNSLGNSEANGGEFSYSPDKDRQKLAQSESGQTEAPLIDRNERSLYKQEQSKPAGRIRSFFSKGKGRGSKNKRRALIAVGGLFGGGGIVALAFLLFMVISGFNVKHVAEVMNVANMARLHIASYRRTSQYLIEESLNPAGQSNFRVERQGKTLFDRLQRFDPNKALSNLRQTDQLGFITQDETKRSWARFGRNVTTSNLAYVQVGDSWIPVPEQTRLNPIANYRNRRNFINGIEAAVNEQEIFKGKSRIFRTKTVNAILEASDIRLYRWANKGRGIKTFKDSILSAYERTRGRSTRSSTLPDVNEAADDYAAALEDGPDNPRSAADLHDRALREALDGRGSTLRNFARGASVTGLTATLYCAGRDYLEARDDNAEDRVIQYKQAGALAQSASHQIESGDVTMNAVMMEAKRWDGFNTSQRYQHTIGNPNASTATPDLDRSEAPVKDEGGALFTFYNSLVRGVDTAAVGFNPAEWASRLDPTGTVDSWNESAKNTGCRAVTSTAGQVVLAVVENAAGVVASVFTGGGATAGQQTARAALQQGFRQAARVAISREVRGEIVSGFTRRAAADIFTFILIDQALKMVMNEGGNAAVDDADKLYAKSDIGTKLIANDTYNAWGGRPLSNREVAELDKVVENQRLATIKKQPLLKRLANLSDPKSPASQLAVSLPYNPESLQNKGVSFAQVSLNPLTNIISNTTKLASGKLGTNTASAYSQINDSDTLGVPTIGYSVSELDRMLEPRFWPQENARFVEDELERNPNAFSDIDDCFEPMTERATTDCTAAQLSSDRALHYRLYRMDGGFNNESSGSSDYNDGILGSLLDTQEITTHSNTGSPNNVSSDGPLPTDVVGIEETALTSGCGGIRVHKNILSSIEALCTAAVSAGLNMTGGGWRDSQAQIEARRRNCGTSDYAIYRMPSSQCSPPTAIPGRSRHERGLAIDFACDGVTIGSRSHRCFVWLDENASRYGLKNLPSEPWHWSTDGS